MNQLGIVKQADQVDAVTKPLEGGAADQEPTC